MKAWRRGDGWRIAGVCILIGCIIAAFIAKMPAARTLVVWGVIACGAGDLIARRERDKESSDDGGSRRPPPGASGEV